MKQLIKKTVATVLTGVMLTTALPTMVSADNDSPFANTHAATEATVAQFMEAFALTGVTVALVDAHTGYTWTQGFGYADTATGRPIDAHSVFNLASISKTVTAVAIMQLADQGLIDLDAPVIQYLPEFSLLPHPIYGGDSDDITVRMLLTHTSGVFPDLGGYGALTLAPYDGFLNNFLDNLSNYLLLSAPGTQALYANTGFNLLGKIVAAVTGEDNPFTDFISYTDAHIFAPLGMENSSFVITEDLMAQLANPYVHAGQADIFVHFNGLPTGGIWSTAYDMALFMHMILGEGTDFISAEALDLIHNVHDFDYFPSHQAFAHGAMRLTDAATGIITYGHGGTLIHYHSNMVWDRASGIGVFVSTNAVTGLSAAMPLASTLLNMAVMEKTGEPLEAVTIIYDLEAEPMTRTYEELLPYTGLFMAQTGNQYYWMRATEAGTIELVSSTYLHDEITMTFIPLSDGSFLDETGMRWTPRYDDNGIMSWFIGAPGIFAFSQRIEPENFITAEEMAPYLGTFHPEMPEGHISIVHTLLVATDRTGLPFMYTFTIHGLVIIAPMMVLEEGMADSEILLGLVSYEYDEHGMATAFVSNGIRFVRAAE